MGQAGFGLVRREYGAAVVVERSHAYTFVFAVGGAGDNDRIRNSIHSSSLVSKMILPWPLPSYPPWTSHQHPRDRELRKKSSSSKTWIPQNAVVVERSKVCQGTVDGA